MHNVMFLYLYKRLQVIIVYFCRNVVISILDRFLFVFRTLCFCFTRQVFHFVPTPLLLTNVYAYLSAIHIGSDFKDICY